MNATTPNPLTPDKSDEATTGGYVPFGTATKAGQVIKGRLPCNGAVLRIPLKGGEPQLVAWGLRNPYGLALTADQGKLLVIENMYDVRGSRPVWGTGDLFRVIDVNAEPLWHGWPDFHGHHELTWEGHYQPPGKPAPKFLLAEHPNPPPKAAAKLGVHAGAGGLDLSRSETFGHAGDAFVALFGDMVPKVGEVMAPVGFRVVRVNPQSGVIEAFAVNRGKSNGPASKLKHGGLERPIAARFDRTGQSLYIVDFGIMTIDKSGPKPRPSTGVLWRVVKEGGVAMTRLGDILLLILIVSALVLAQAGCGSARRAEPLVGPIELSTPQLQRGQQVFMQHCYQCHPGGRAGLGPAINNKLLPAPLIKSQVRLGLGAMPAFGEQHISEKELEAVTEYLAALRQAGKS